MVKAVDGGGGRGIRLVRGEEEFDDAFRRACAESPGGRVFVEKAAGVGARHVEVQVVGDGRGVRALGTRDCSVQRRFQKVVEYAPASGEGAVVGEALRMAGAMGFVGVGTWEFLVDGERAWFLEINPRLQVEHTVTEEVYGVDLVRLQLQIAQGQAITGDLGHPRGFAVQLRITAEDVDRAFALSIGRVRRFVAPTGQGIRVDTHLRAGEPTVVGTEFDSLLCKLVVRAETWEAVVAKAARALEDTVIEGVKTNMPLLKAIVAAAAFQNRDISITWLESTLEQLLLPTVEKALFRPIVEDAPVLGGGSGGPPLLRKGDAWSLHLSLPASTEVRKHHVTISKLLQNDFPNSVAAEITHVYPGGSGTFRAVLSKTTIAAVGNHRRGDVARAEHVVVPFGGSVVEVNVRVGERVRVGDVVCVVRQMKTELEVRAAREGVVRWAWEAELEEVVEGGELVCELELGVEAKL